MPHRIAWEEIEWQQAAQGLRTRTVVRQGQQLRMVEFSHGFVEPDWCLKPHTGWVLEGQMELDVNGSVLRLQAGDSLWLPGGPANRHKHHRTVTTTTLFLVEPSPTL